MAKPEKDEPQKVGFGDTYEYKGKIYHYIDEVRVKLKGAKDEWTRCVLYYNNHGKFAREKSEFFKLFTKTKI